MTYLEWCKENNIRSYKNYCTCGGYAHTMNGRNKEHPHLSWCAQYEEYEELYFKYSGQRNDQ